jgi:hypothetical protein
MTTSNIIEELKKEILDFDASIKSEFLERWQKLEME